MIYLISDIHSEINFRGLIEYISIAKNDDLLVVLGDLELKFYDTEENHQFTQEFLAINKNIAFIDGNHENHQFINSFPVEEWNGGKVHRLTKNIVHLIRGNIYLIENKSFFVMGGCKSSKKWYDSGVYYDGEIPNKLEIEFAYKNLENSNYSVDYILTHKYKVYESFEPRTLEELTSFIDKKVKFKIWYSGHWHKVDKLDDNHHLVYDKLVKI